MMFSEHPKQKSMGEQGVTRRGRGQEIIIEGPNNSFSKKSRAWEKSHKKEVRWSRHCEEGVQGEKTQTRGGARGKGRHDEKKDRHREPALPSLHNVYTQNWEKAAVQS